MSIFKFLVNNKQRLILIGILLLALFFRFYQLTQVPPPLYSDEAAYAMDALKTFQRGDFKVFYPDNYGREGLFMWLNALVFKIFGPSLLAFKLTGAVFGFLTVLGIYLLAALVFNKKVAIWAAFFASFSFWPVHFSRLGFRACLMPLFSLLAFYFLIRGLEGKRFFDFLLGGIFLGLGFYTYLAYRMMVIIILVFLVVLFWKKKKLFLEKIKGLVSYLGVGIITALPLGLYFLNNPQDFFGRAQGVSVFSLPNPFLAFFKSLSLNFLSFFAFGDLNWRHNFSGWPLLIFPLSLFFIFGLIWFLIKGFRYLLDQEESIYYFFFLLWFLVMLLPAALAFEGSPHSLRLIGEIPPVFIMAAFGWDWFSKRIKNWKYLTVFFLLLLCLLPGEEFYRYQVVWASKKEVQAEFTGQLANIAFYYNQLDPSWKKYVLCNLGGVEVDGYPIQAQTIKFLTFGQSQVYFLNKEDLFNLPLKPQSQKFIISLMQPDDQILSFLQEKFPQGKVLKISNPPNPQLEFYAFQIGG